MAMQQNYHRSEKIVNSYLIVGHKYIMKISKGLLFSSLKINHFFFYFPFLLLLSPTYSIWGSLVYLELLIHSYYVFNLKYFRYSESAKTQLWDDKIQQKIKIFIIPCFKLNNIQLNTFLYLDVVRILQTIFDYNNQQSKSLISGKYVFMTYKKEMECRQDFEQK
ncbi:hypothetical protein pb186bvf_004748 [Paramecium bursaria]